MIGQLRAKHTPDPFAMVAGFPSFSQDRHQSYSLPGQEGGRKAFPH